ncbi:MAG: hypothetical protein R3B60_01195 [Candidatus Paceibacterota bacterium]
MATAENTADFQSNKSKNQTAKRTGGDRLNDDWQYLKENDVPNNPTVDQKFNLQYKHSGVNKVKVTKPKTTDVTTDNQGRVVQNFKTRAEGQIPVANLIKTPHRNSSTNLSVTTKIKKKQAKIIGRWTSSLYIGYWPTVQLPLGIFSLVGFALSGAATAIADTISSNGNFIFNTVRFVFGGIYDFTTNLIGFSLEDVSLSIFFIPHLLLLGINMIIMFSLFVFYKKNNIESLGGSHAGAKYGAFLLAIIGYSIPLFNLAPWLLVWTTVVAKYPR